MEASLDFPDSVDRSATFAELIQELNPSRRLGNRDER
jgi:hypothetical protein